jgi:CheY-like chemotaxis protein
MSPEPTRRFPLVETVVGESIATQRWSVLVVESDDAVRATVVEGLRDCGLLVEAVNGVDGIDGWHGDVIVTDTFASPYRTEAAVAYLKDLRSRFTVGVVVLTAHNGASADIAQLPADAVVMKPFDLEDLVAVVTAVARDRANTTTRSADDVDYYPSAHEEAERHES